MAHQLYAKIKPSSKYFYQNDWAIEEGLFPFSVQIIPQQDAYWVKGGPGGQYWFEDVDLFIIVDGYEIKLKKVKVTKVKK